MSTRTPRTVWLLAAALTLPWRPRRALQHRAATSAACPVAILRRRVGSSRPMSVLRPGSAGRRAGLISATIRSSHAGCPGGLAPPRLAGADEILVVEIGRWLRATSASRRASGHRLRARVWHWWHARQRRHGIAAASKQPLPPIGCVRLAPDEGSERGNQLVEDHVADDQPRVNPLACLAFGHVMCLPEPGHARGTVSSRGVSASSPAVAGTVGSSKDVA